MKIIVSHVFSNHNKGDAALLSVLLCDIKKTFPKASIKIFTIDKISKDETFEGVPVENAISHYALSRYNNVVFKLLYSLYVMGLTILWAIIYRFSKKEIYLPKDILTVMQAYREADLIVPVGGGYIRGHKGIKSTFLLLMLLHPIALSQILRKPTIIYSQSVGPFGNKFQRFLAKHVLKNVKTIVIREDVSLGLLQNMGITHNVIRSIDVGFLFSSETKIDLKKKLGVPEDQLLVGITVRSWLDSKRQSLYQEAIAKFADHIIREYNASVVFVPQVTATYHHDDDRDVGKAIYELIDQKERVYVLMNTYNHHDIKAIYSSLDYTIGTRFHSVIFSLTSNVPAIAIEYEHKTGGIMHDLGLDRWVIKIEDVTPQKLNILFAQLVKEKDPYKKHLREVLPPYMRRAQELPILMQKAAADQESAANS